MQLYQKLHVFCLLLVKRFAWMDWAKQVLQMMRHNPMKNVALADEHSMRVLDCNGSLFLLEKRKGNEQWRVPWIVIWVNEYSVCWWKSYSTILLRNHGLLGSNIARRRWKGRPNILASSHRKHWINIWAHAHIWALHKLAGLRQVYVCVYDKWHKRIICEQSAKEWRYKVIFPLFSHLIHSGWRMLKLPQSTDGTVITHTQWTRHKMRHKMRHSGTVAQPEMRLTV